LYKKIDWNLFCLNSFLNEFVKYVAESLYIHEKFEHELLHTKKLTLSIQANGWQTCRVGSKQNYCNGIGKNRYDRLLKVRVSNNLQITWSTSFNAMVLLFNKFLKNNFWNCNF